MIYTKVYLIAINSKFDVLDYQLEVKITDYIREKLLPEKISEGVLEKN